MTVAAEADDSRLMWDIAAGDRQAFGRLMQKQLPRAYAIAFRLLANAQEAEDVAQEALLRVWRNAGAFDPKRAQFSTWFYRIVVNLAFDRMRRAKTSPRTAPLELATEVAESRPNAESQLLAQLHRSQIAAALEALPERQRAAVVLVHYEGLSGREAAEALSMTPKALESQLYRALKALRQSLLEQDIDLRRIQ